MRPVKSKARKEELNELLVEALEDREIDDVHLAAPETLDWQDIDGFRFNRSDPEAELDADPRISAYLDSREDEEIDLQLLKDDRGAVRRGNHAPQHARRPACLALRQERHPESTPLLTVCVSLLRERRAESEVLPPVDDIGPNVGSPDPRASRFGEPRSR